MTDNSTAANKEFAITGAPYFADLSRGTKREVISTNED